VLTWCVTESTDLTRIVETVRTWCPHCSLNQTNKEIAPPLYVDSGGGGRATYLIFDGSLAQTKISTVPCTWWIVSLGAVHQTGYQRDGITIVQCWLHKAS
jgi:hypothetical protein